ncbi:hypothetical protein [Corticicoccus populi]|uniref:Uncharacterized protein n=1 Tax=Corticicoccus populi TaxID=1812821 RepID=A0ABW5WVI7_9STAP
MNMDYRMNQSDISPNINIPRHSKGVSVIQYTDRMDTEIITRTDVQHIIVSDNEEIIRHYKERTTVLGTIEQAKMYVKYSHYIVLSGSETLHLNDDFSFGFDDIVLIKIKSPKTVDEKIYDYFYHTFKTDNLTVSDMDKVISNHVLLPSCRMFRHVYQSNIETDRYLDRLSVISVSEVKLFKNGIEMVYERDDTEKEIPFQNAAAEEDTYTILSELDRLSLKRNSEVLKLLKYFKMKHTLFLKNQIDRKDMTREAVINRLEAAGVKPDTVTLNKGSASKLVLAYCFPPYNDTSGNVMAKRMHSEGEVSDVISNNMSRIRTRDEKLLSITDTVLDTQLVLDGPQAFSSWYSIERYMDDGLEQYLMFRDKYQTVYSRAMFPHSHFLGFQIKKDSNIHWVAEFSDPLHKDVKGDLRYAPIDDGDYINSLKAAVDDRYHHLIDDNVFNICELLPFLYADELIFTNHFQLEDMLERFDEDIQSSVRQRARISSHPSPSADMYTMEQSLYPLDNETIHLAYFGNFYDTRGFRQLELAAKYLYESGINNFMIHVFTNLKSGVHQQYSNSDFKHYFKINPFVTYFECLNLTRRMDILMIFDAETKGIKAHNPYIPSKYSDYKQSGSLTWAFTEAGSTLDSIEQTGTYITRQHDYHLYSKTFRTLSEILKKPLYRASNIECVK